MKQSLFICSVLLALLTIGGCTKSANNSPSGYVVSGQFTNTGGSCTPYCLVSISGTTFTLNGINYSGSTTIIYTEMYTRSSANPNVYNLTNIQGSYITVSGTTGFTFTSTSKTCTFSK